MSRKKTKRKSSTARKRPLNPLEMDPAMLSDFSLQKNKVGRPTVMTESVLDKLIQAFAIGATVAEACLFAGVSDEAYYGYLKRNPEFAKRKRQLQKNPVLRARFALIQLLDKQDAATVRWVLERKCRKEFGAWLKQELEIDHKNEVADYNATRVVLEIRDSMMCDPPPAAKEESEGAD